MSSQQVGASSSASLRPRNRRLISIEDDANNRARSVSPAGSDNGRASASSLSTERAPSPLPSAHPSRANTRQRPTQRHQNGSKTWGFQAPSTIASNPLFTPGYWETSWSSIQGIASTLLGSDLDDNQRSGKGSRKKRNAHKSQYSISTPDEWGPAAAEQSLAYGSHEDRLARVQAKKRETLLLANGHTTPDALGRHKRRTSVDQDALGSPKYEQPDTRVYLHHVQKADTLAGLSIRFNCPQTIIQKANRLWPNDSIQIRDIAYIPVDSCGVRGLKIPTPKSSIDLHPKESTEDSLPTPTQAMPDWTVPKTPTAPSAVQSPALTISSVETDVPHTHDSWVSIDHIPTPVEVARLSRRDLGFFPPARRKSVTYADSTPPQSPPQSSSTHSPTSRGRHLSPVNRPHRSASSTSASAAYFLRHLRGPGGVGSLDSKSRSPGPSRDKLNEMFAGHLPNMAAPRSSFESVTSASSTATGLNELGGRVEGWMRKIATKKAEKGSSEGDLIELVEGWDMGGVGGSSEGGQSGIASTSEGAVRLGDTAAKEEEERLLQERFPVRGRVFQEQSKR